MPDKPKVAFYWGASCGGCEESIVDLAEDLLMVAENVEIVFWPVAMDFKKSDVESLADNEITATLFNGAIRSSEQEEMAHLLRRKSQILIAHGACAHLGGVPSLSNQFTREQILKFVYEDGPMVDNPEAVRPRTETKVNGHTAVLPELHNLCRSLDQVVDVDYYLPGCSTPPKLIKNAVLALLSGELPPKGSVLAPDIALCEECPRKESKPSDLSFTEFKRPHQAAIDPDVCLLAQGIVCMGPATRGGCEAACIKGNMPCTGCFGPTSRVRDQGAKILSSLCANISATEDEDIEKILSGIPDPVGTFYRYGLSKSLLRAKVERKTGA